MRLLLTLALLLSTAAVTVFGQSRFLKETSEWRTQHAGEIGADDGWLTVFGLFWLKEGTTSIGTDQSRVDIAMPPNSAPARIGSLKLENGVVTLQVDEGAAVTVKGQPVHEYVMRFEGDKPPDQFEVGSLKLGVIKRADRYGLRVRNKNSAARMNFKGLRWFPARESYRVVATFTPFPEPTELNINNVLGDELKMKTPGILTFTLQGKKFELRPLIEDEKKLFIIFRDLTAGKTTYPAGRFLYAELPKDGKVVLDFNRSENPPCAFTDFATCPLPPRQNFMNVSINAGEKRYK